MIYKIIRKIYNKLLRSYIIGLVSFKDKIGKYSFGVETGVHIYNPNVVIGKNVKIYHNVIIFGDGPVTIGDGSKIGYNTIIYSSKNAGVYIGDNCAIAANAYIIDTNHSTDLLIKNIQENDKSEKVVIGNNVWISAQCVIGKGSKLGNNVVVAANSFVNKAFPDNAIIGGSPAKLIKYRGEQ